MDAEQFIRHYLKPSHEGLDKSFVIQLPDSAGLRKCGEFIVQGRQDATCSTNIIAAYESKPEGVRVVEVYKNTEDQEKGLFVRLVGTMALVKKGNPFLFLDAAVSNVSPLTAQREELSTRVAVHLPQVDDRERQHIFGHLTRRAADAGFASKELALEMLPPFWGPLWTAHAEGLELGMIEQIRHFAWEAYADLCRRYAADQDFDYTPVQHHMVFNHSQAEHRLFKRMGLSVPAEAQAAFFSVLVAGV